MLCENWSELALRLDKSLLVKNLVLNHKLVQHIDKEIDKGEFEWKAEFIPKTEDDAFHPSSWCMPSAYTLYHMALGAEAKSPSVSLRKSFVVGHFWHAYIQQIVVESLGFATWDQVERRGETRWGDGPYHWATGAGDIAPCTIPAHGEYLIDIKTMGTHDFRPNKLPNWCAAKYECQVNIYMDWFDLDRALILCVQKDSPHDMKEFSFSRNQPLIDAVYGKWKLVSECLDKNVEPPEDYHVEMPIEGPCV